MANLTGVRCLSIGRALARTECGLAYAARAVASGRAADLELGLSTVRQSIKYVAGMMGGAPVQKIVTQAAAISRRLEKEKKISKAGAKQIFKTLQGLKVEVDRLFAQSASQCPGDGKRKKA